jgi:hypothetical protein
MDAEFECPECGAVVRGQMANVDEPILIDLPLEPPRNRIIEMVNGCGEVVESYVYDEKVGEWSLTETGFHFMWYEIVGDAMSAGETLRSVRNEEEVCI